MRRKIDEPTLATEAGPTIPESNYKAENGKKGCVLRESNPALILGRDKS